MKAQKLGRNSIYQSPDERAAYKDTLIKGIEAEAEREKEQLTLNGQKKVQEEKQLLSELARIGNPPEEIVRSDYRKGLCTASFVALPIGAESAFLFWTFGFLGLKAGYTIIIAAAIVILSLEAFDYYITAFRQRYRHYDNVLFLILGSMSVIAIFLVLLFIAEIRHSLYELTSTLESDNSPEEILIRTQRFRSNSSNDFLYSMCFLTITVTMVGGTSFHLSKSLILGSRPALRLYKQLRKVRDEMIRLGEQISNLKARVPEFESEFEKGLKEEQLKQLRIEEKARKNEIKWNRIKERIKAIAPVILLPITIILITIAVFFLLRGEAKGAEYIVLIDISKSTDVSQYSGKGNEFNKSTKAVESIIRNDLSAGDKIKALAVTERSFSRPFFLLNDEIPKKKGAFGENLARKKIQLLKKWKGLDLKPTAKATDLLGALFLASILYSSDKDKRLIIFSDMRNTSELNIERLKKIDVQRSISIVEKLGLIPDLKGTRVSCLGIHSVGKSPSYWLSLREFWKEFFRRAGAEALTFSIERRLSHE